MQCWSRALLLDFLQGIRGESLSESHAEEPFLAATLIGEETYIRCSETFTWMSMIWFSAA